MRKRFEATITGRVQGVMFRDFTQRTAKKLGIVGTVKNNLDGSVQVIAEGKESRLKDLEQALWKGPLISRMVARVDDVYVTWSEPAHEFTDFRILY